jgi:uncharacterized membrane protein
MLDTTWNVRKFGSVPRAVRLVSSGIRPLPLIIAWILAASLLRPGSTLAESRGAPAKKPLESVATPANLQETPPDGQKENPRRKESSLFARLGRLIGKFHVLVVHFPIALFLEAVLAELLSMWRKERTPSSVVRFCVLLGAAGAVSAAGLGWLHAAFSAAGPRQILFIHRWLGTMAAAWSVGTVALSEFDVRSKQRSRRFSIVLFLGAGLIGLAAHFGGTLVFGLDYFKW